MQSVISMLKYRGANAIFFYLQIGFRNAFKTGNWECNFTKSNAT